MREDTLISYHVFLLPFQWKPSENGNWDSNLLDFLGEKWKPNHFSFKPSADGWFNAARRYNEFVYFHDFCRPILYDFDPAFQRTEEGRTFIRHFEMKQPPAHYEIKLKDQPLPYRLKVKSILANFYWMGVGMLSIHLENHTYAAPEDILKINEFGRRIYPPYLPLSDSQDSVLSEQLGFSEGPKETFDVFGAEPSIPKLPEFLNYLFRKLDEMDFRIIGDDRMFVHCLYKNDLESKKAEPSTSLQEHHDEFLYKFIFVNVGTPHVADKATYEEAMQDHVYRRWAEAGTVFGVTRYSFVCLSRTTAPAHVEDHMRTMYYKLVELTLIQRASILAFQGKITTVSGSEVSLVNEYVQKLYQDHYRFVNKVYFREVTAQEQGIHLYDLLQTQMRIHDHLTSLQSEMDNLHEYASVVAEGRRNDRLEMITRVGSAFLIPSFIAGYLGMNVFTEDTNPHWITVFLTLIGVPLLAWVLLFSGKGNQQHKWRYVVLIGSIILAVLGLAANLIMRGV